MQTYQSTLERIRSDSRRWLVTGAAGFIGSSLVETLLKLNQRVTGLDNFSAGHRANLDQVRSAVSENQWKNFRFIEGDIRSAEDTREGCRSVDYVLHQAALGSVPRSMEDPLGYHESNVSGFVNMLMAARAAGVERFVYASSSATYGDHPGLPKIEAEIGRALSPYGLTKHVNELYAGTFARCYGLESIGLRYFNVFGPRQDPNGAYAAVIPTWIAAMIRNDPIFINGDGGTVRDFCHVDNVIQANLLAAMVDDPAAVDQVYNIALGERITLNQLFEIIRSLLEPRYPNLRDLHPVYREARPADVRLSHADIDKARRLLGYRPVRSVSEGLAQAAEWYVATLAPRHRITNAVPQSETALSGF